MIIAITGGTGFVGSELVARHLKMGDTVRVLTRKNQKQINCPAGMEIITGDLINSDQSLISFVNNADILYHCAAELDKPEKMFLTHIEGTKNLLEAAKGRIGRWVQLSSVGVYGAKRQGEVTENSSINPKGQYEITKAGSDELVIQNCSEENMMYSVLRPSNIYGPGMTRSYFFQMIKLIDYGLFFFIGRPGAKANYIHVNNVIEALMFCGQKKSAINKIYNLSDCLTIEEFVGSIAKELEKKLPVVRLPEHLVRLIARISKIFPGFPLTPSRVDALTLRSWYSNQKIIDELGYVHPKKMCQGIKEMVDTYRIQKMHA